MAIAIPGGSLWLASGSGPRFAPLSGSGAFDAVVLGAGITGLCTAHALQADGLSVAVAEQRWIGAGATGKTTAKLSSLQGTRYSRIRSRLGASVARDYALANEQGISEIKRLSDELGIDCELRQRPNYVYAEGDDELRALETEAEAARDAGLPVEWVDEVPLPFAVKAALRLDHQAEFHPVKFINGIADAFVAAGGTIYEETRALGVSGSQPLRVETDRGKLLAPTVVLATNFPFTDRALLFARMHPERSYSIAACLEGEPPEGMFINVSSPTRSIRSHPHEGAELLLIGGEGHKTGQGGATAPRYERLRRFAERHFGAGPIEFGWSTQDNITIDGAPYVGRPLPGAPGLLTATGYAKWGLAMAATAAGLLADMASEREPSLAPSFDPKRLPPPASLPEIAREGADFSLRLVGDRLRGLLAQANRIAPGSGAIVRAGRRQLAIARSEKGELSARSARCPHMGCIVAWNDAEQSWDCPCHGSRFAADGSLLHGPAVDDLPAEDL